MPTNSKCEIKRVVDLCEIHSSCTQQKIEAVSYVCVPEIVEVKND